MKKALLDSRRSRGIFWLRIFCAALAVAFFTGCRALPQMPAQVQDLGPVYRPSNIYRRAGVLPPQVRRVALLPLTATASTPYLEAGVEALEPGLYSELEKSKRFEIIPVTGEQLKQWTGQTGWRSDEQLPPDLFERIKARTGCDAVLFSQLTRYQPYPPLAVGWKFSLVENPKISGTEPGNIHPLILWSADEVLDAGDPPVSTGARAYYSQHLRNDAASADPATMLSSPTRFGQYTLWVLISTLPERGDAAH